MGTNCKFMMWWSLIDVFSFASWNMHNCIACIHVLHFSLGLFPVVLLLLWVRLTAGRSHRLSGSLKRLRGLWSSWEKVNRIELNDPDVWACSVELWSGAGAAYARAEKEIRELVEVTGIPFLPTPMGKGVLPDDHSNCVAAARSRCVNVCKWSLQNLFLMEPTDVMWCPSLSVLELYCRLML